MIISGLKNDLVLNIMASGHNSTADIPALCARPLSSPFQCRVPCAGNACSSWIRRKIWVHARWPSKSPSARSLSARIAAISAVKVPCCAIFWAAQAQSSQSVFADFPREFVAAFVLSLTLYTVLLAAIKGLRCCFLVDRACLRPNSGTLPSNWSMPMAKTPG